MYKDSSASKKILGTVLFYIFCYIQFIIIFCLYFNGKLPKGIKLLREIVKDLRGENKPKDYILDG